MSDGPDPDRLLQLEQRIEAAKGGDDAPHLEEHYSQAQHAWRMVTELVAGIGIGFGIGYGLDTLLGTTPWLMIIFVLFGLAAGVKTMISTAQELQLKTQAAEAAEDKRAQNGGG